MKQQLTVPEEYRDIAAICTATEIEIGGNKVIGIADLRTLHKGLGVRTGFPDWLKRRVVQSSEFEEGVDHELWTDADNEHSDLSVRSSKQRNGGRRPGTARLTLTAAKRLAMAEHNEVGANVRGYFIWAETQLLAGGREDIRPRMSPDQVRAMIREENARSCAALVDTMKGMVDDAVRRTNGAHWGMMRGQTQHLDGRHDRHDLDIIEVGDAVYDTKKIMDRSSVVTAAQIQATLHVRLGPGFASKMSQQLGKWCMSHGMQAGPRYEGGPWVFPRAEFEDWYVAEGKTFIDRWESARKAKERHHRRLAKDAADGQTNLFQFHPAPKKRH